MMKRWEIALLMPKEFPPYDGTGDWSSIAADWLEDHGYISEAAKFRGSVGKVEEFDDLLGHTITEIVSDVNELRITLANCQSCALYHSQECCEHVSIENIQGDLQSLVGLPLIEAKEDVSDTTPEGVATPSDSFTWTTYTLATAKGSVRIRWLGESNGYYSESVDFRVK